MPITKRNFRYQPVWLNGTRRQQLLQSHLKTRATNHGAGCPLCGGYIFPTQEIKLSRTNLEQHGPAQNQVALLYALIQRFGPNQAVGVPTFGNPLENLFFERVFFPETLHSCLFLPYILWFIIIHRVPESSFPPRHRILQGVINGMWEQCTYRAW